MSHTSTVALSSPSLPNTEAGLFMRGFVGSAVLLVAINASEPLLFGESYFSDLAWHPFWIVILLAAVQHGLFVGLSIVGLATMMIDWPARPVGIDITAHYLDIAITPVQWLVVALTIGLYRQQQLQQARALANENKRLLDVNRTLAEEIHRLDAFVARAELVAATRVIDLPQPGTAPDGDPLEALDRLARAEAGWRALAFLGAARACLPTPVVWLDIDENGHFSPAAVTHCDVQISEGSPADFLNFPVDEAVPLAPGEGPVPESHHALCRAVRGHDRQSKGAILVLAQLDRDLQALQPALHALCLALENSLSRASVAVGALPPCAEPEPTYGLNMRADV